MNDRESLAKLNPIRPPAILVVLLGPQHFTALLLMGFWEVTLQLQMALSCLCLDLLFDFFL